jgi:TetR/AcrR family transcriptional repressor of nem operon
MQPKQRPRGEVRAQILRTAFREFYVHGFQGGNVNRIIAEAGTTKGAFFHHFPSKEDLGFAVIDETIAPLMKTRWLQPIAESIDVIADLKAQISALIEKDIASGNYVLGCPLNNLAQEMSAVDERFRIRIEAIYAQWRETLAGAIARGVKHGSVTKTLSPSSTAGLFVAAQMGIWGTARNAKDAQLMRSSGKALCEFLGSLQTKQSD